MHAATNVPLLLYSAMFCPVTAASFPNISFITSQYFRQGGEHGVISTPAPGSSLAFYSTIMAAYAATGVMGAFEIDYMDFLLLAFDEFAADLTSAAQWADGFANAALAYRQAVQLCMTLPAFVLASVQWPAVTSARGTEDNVPTNDDRWQIAYASMLFAALDLR